MEPGEYETIARVENKHWWYRGMAAISLALLAPLLQAISRQTGKPVRILDAGCGPGGMFKTLRQFGPTFGIDLHPLATQFAKHQSPVAQASVERLPFGNACFQLITSFDVLYHLAVSDDYRALAEFYRVLEPGGLLLVRVPALKWLAGAHDRQVHTRERYTAPQLAQKLQATGFKIIRLTYANFLLLPFILMRRRFQPTTTAETDVDLPAPHLNRLLEGILLLEREWLTFGSLPLGVSLFALAVKPEAAHVA